MKYVYFFSPSINNEMEAGNSQSKITSDSSALYFMVMDIMSIALYAIAILLIPNIYDP